MSDTLAPVPNEIELIEVKKGRFMRRDEALAKGYNWVWLQLAEKPKKGESAWGAAGLAPIIVIALSLYMMSWIMPVIKAGAVVVINPIFEIIRQK